MFFGSKKCVETGVTTDIMRCPFCRKPVTKVCLSPLILREKTHIWLIGKKVANLQEYFELHKEFKKDYKKKGGHVHICEEYLKEAWQGIRKQVKDFENMNDAVAKTITLK